MSAAGGDAVRIVASSGKTALPTGAVAAVRLRGLRGPKVKESASNIFYACSRFATVVLIARPVIPSTKLD
jgi:hypothetical protein